MGIWEIVVGSLVLILSVVIIIFIILQEGHQSDLGTITGGADSFLSRGKAKTADAFFARLTKWCAVIFFFLVVLLNALSYFGLTGLPDTKTEVQTSAVESVAESSTESSSEESSNTSGESSAESKTEESKQQSAESSAAESKTESAESTEQSAESSNAAE